MSEIKFTADLASNGQIVYVAGADYVGVRVGPKGGGADRALILEPRGEGPIQAQITDNTLAGGNVRGIYATDWQRTRTIVNQVASGDYAAIGGGRNNRSAGISSVVAGGNLNQANSSNAAILGGTQNIIDFTATFGVIGGGRLNRVLGTFDAGVFCGRGNEVEASSTYSFIGGGLDNNIDGSMYAVIGGGQDNIIASSDWSGILHGLGNTILGNTAFAVAVGGVGNVLDNASASSFTLGGQHNTVDGTFGGGAVGGAQCNVTAPCAIAMGGWDAQAGSPFTLAQGVLAHANHHGEVAFGGAPTTWGLGTAQRSTVLWTQETANAALTNLQLGDAASDEFEFEEDTLYTFQIHVVAKALTGGLGVRWWQVTGGAYRLAANVILIPQFSILGGFAGTAGGWSFTIPDNVGTMLRLQVEGEAGRDIRWVATGYFTKVME